MILYLIHVYYHLNYIIASKNVLHNCSSFIPEIIEDMHQHAHMFLLSCVLSLGYMIYFRIKSHFQPKSSYEKGLG